MFKFTYRNLIRPTVNKQEGQQWSYPINRAVQSGRRGGEGLYRVSQPTGARLAGDAAKPTSCSSVAHCEVCNHDNPIHFELKYGEML